MRTMHQFYAGLAILLIGLFMVDTARGADVDDASALRGVDTGKAVFLVDIGSAKKLALYLDVIQGTYRRLERQDVKPDFVLAFIGPSVKFLTSEPDDETAMRHEELLARIGTSVDELAALDDVRLEICKVALDVFEIDPKTVLPELEVVGDGFISVIGYQAQGYHLVPVY